MNLPVGEAIEQGIRLPDFDEKATLEMLADKMFSGYVVVTVEGFKGVEEGLLLIKKGAIVGALYEYTKHEITVLGDSALPQAFNAFAAKNGIAEIYSLSNQQVDLVTAFNDKIKTAQEIGKRSLGKYLAKKYDISFAEKTLEGVVSEHESKKDVFKRLGLSGLGE